MLPLWFHLFQLILLVSGVFFVRQLCKVLLNKKGNSTLNATSGTSSSFSSSKAKDGDCLNHRIALIFMATHVRTCDLHGEERERALVCVVLDSAGHQQKQSEDTVQSEKDPVLVCFSFLHVKKKKKPL